MKVRSLIDANYADFVPSVTSNEEVLHEGGILQSEMRSMQENLNNEMKNMHSSNDQISQLVEDLEETQKALKISLKLVKIDAFIHKIKLCNESKRYNEIHQLLVSIETLIDDPKDKIIRRLDCIKNMKHRLTVERCNLKFSLEEEFNRLIQMKEKNFPKTRAITFTITKNTVEIVDCIHSLFQCEFSFDSFITFIMENIFQPVVSRAVSMNIKENPREFVLSLSYSVEPISDELRPTYPTVFQNLEEILKLFLNMNVVNSEGNHFLGITFNEQKPKIMNMIFEECLIYCIPKTFEENAQSTMKDDMRKFSHLLTEFHLFEHDENEMIERICERIDEHFNQQFTKNVQATATELLKHDLHNMILISDDTTLSTTTPLTFPKSQISKSTLELIKLLEKIIKQGQESGKMNQVHNSVKCVLENYTFSIQLHHSQLLSKIPQQTALFYNNCNYLSNWALTNKDLDFSNTENVMFELKQQGEEFFDCQVAKQKIQLLDILKEFGEISNKILLINKQFDVIIPLLRSFIVSQKCSTRTL